MVATINPELPEARMNDLFQTSRTSAAYPGYAGTRLGRRLGSPLR
jgi:hypothetical protein